MNWVFLIVGGVLSLVGLGLLWWRHSVGKQIAVMAGMPTTRAADLASLAPGTFVEVKGTLRVREPLVGEFSQRPAAYFRCEIQREETYYERDSKGQSQRRTRTTTIYQNMKYGSCLIEDESGRAGIDFDGADVEAVQVVNEPTSNPSNSGSSAIGAVTGVLNALGGRSESFRRIEHALAPDIPVYVLAEVRSGGLLGKPASGSKNSFVISHKSEEERTKSLKWTRLWLLVGAIIFLIVGLVLIPIGFSKPV